MTDVNEQTDVVIDPKVSKPTNIKFNFSGDVNSSDSVGSQSRFNNHLLLKAKSDAAMIDSGSSRRGTETGNNLKLKKKKKFSWAKVQNAIKKTFHSGSSSSKKKYTKKKKETGVESFRSSESNIISSAVYQNEEDVKKEKSHKDKEKKKENGSKETLKSNEKNNNKKSENDPSNEESTTSATSTKLSNSKQKISKSENDLSNNDNNDNDNNNNYNNDKNNDNKDRLSHHSEGEEKTHKKSLNSAVNNTIEEDSYKGKHGSGYLYNSNRRLGSTDRYFIYGSTTEEIVHKYSIEKDTSEEFYKSICGNYYRYDSDESSESIYSDIDSLPDVNKLKGHHHKQISMSYPSVNNSQSTISMEKLSIDKELYISGSLIIEEKREQDDEMESSSKGKRQSNQFKNDEEDKKIIKNSGSNKRNSNLINSRQKQDTNISNNSNEKDDNENDGNNDNDNNNDNDDNNNNNNNNNNKNNDLSHSQFLDVPNKSKHLINKEYSSDGEVAENTLNENKRNIQSNTYSEDDINEMKHRMSQSTSFDKYNNNNSKKKEKLYQQLVKNIKIQNNGEEYSASSIIDIGIKCSDTNIVNSENNENNKTDIDNLTQDVSERVDITDLGDEESLKTASIEDCTSQLNMDEEEVEIEGIEKAYQEGINKNNNNNSNNNNNNNNNNNDDDDDNNNMKIIINDELNHRYKESLDSIIEEKGDNSPNTIQNNNNKYNERDNGSITNNNSLEVCSLKGENNRYLSLKNYMQNNISVPDTLNDLSKQKDNSYKGHVKRNSYNDSKDFKTNQHGNLNVLSTLSAFSNISGSYSYSGNLFGTFRSDTSDRFSDKVNKYYSLKTENKSNSLKIKNSSRDFYPTFKKGEPRYRLDKSLNSSISKRSKRTLNTIHFMAKYYNENGSNSNNGEDDAFASDADLSSGLTAKEFAKLVGINILYDDDEKEDLANLQKQGILKQTPNPHQPIDLSIFIPPNPTELATLHPTTITKSFNLEELKEEEKKDSKKNKDETTLSNTTDEELSTFNKTVYPNNNIMTINNENQFTQKNNDFNHRDLEDNNEGKVYSQTITTANHTFAVTSTGTPLVKTMPNDRPVSFDIEGNTITQSTVSAKGRTFEVSFSSNKDFSDGAKPVVYQSMNALNQGNRVRNSKTEPDIHGNDSISKTLSRNSSCGSNNRLMGNIKSTSNIRNNIPAISIVHGGPSEEMCRSILEKANPLIKIDREPPHMFESPMSELDNTPSDLGIEHIKLGETQTKPLNNLNINNSIAVDNQAKSPIITSQPAPTKEPNHSPENINSKVITYNKPLLSNNSKVIFFRSKRNNYINLQSTNIDGNRHRQFHRKRFEVRSSKPANYNKPSVEEEEEEEAKDAIGNEMKVTPSKRNSLFYSMGSSIKNLRNFSFTSNRQSPLSSLPTTPNHDSAKVNFDTSSRIASGSSVASNSVVNASDKANITGSIALATANIKIQVQSPISSPSLISPLLSPTNITTSPTLAASLVTSPLPLELNSPINNKPNEILLLPLQPDHYTSPHIDISQLPLTKTIVIPSSTPSVATPSTTHTVITQENNQTVITTTTTTSNRHTFITTKTTSIKNTSIPRNGLLIDTKKLTSSSTPSSPITSIIPVSAIQSECISKDEVTKMIPANSNSLTMGNDTNSTHINSTVSNISITTNSKHSSYNNNDSINGFGRISSYNDNNSFYKCKKNMSSFDVPNSPALSDDNIKKVRTVSLSNPRGSSHEGIAYSRFSNSNIDIASLDRLQRFETQSGSPPIKPLMISTSNAIKISNSDIIHGTDSLTQSNSNILSSISNNNNTFVSALPNTNITASPVSDANYSSIFDTLPFNSKENSNNNLTNQSIKSNIPSSPSLNTVSSNLSQQQNQQSMGVMIPRHPKSLYIPRSRNVQIIKNNSNGNISNSSKLTTEEVKGRFQIEKSEERKITTISFPTKANSEGMENSGASASRRNNSYSMDDKYENNGNKDNSSLYFLRSNSSTLDVNGEPIGNNKFYGSNTYMNDNDHDICKPNMNDKHYFITNKFAHLKNNYASSCDNIPISDKSKIKGYGTTEQGSVKSVNIVKSITGKNISEGELSRINVHHISSDFINDPLTINSAPPSKKKEIVKGRFTIIRDS